MLSVPQLALSMAIASAVFAANFKCPSVFTEHCCNNTDTAAGVLFDYRGFDRKFFTLRTMQSSDIEQAACCHLNQGRPVKLEKRGTRVVAR